MALSKSATYDKSIEVHVLTDRSEEIDDELCIKYLRELKEVPLKLLFIFTGTESITSLEAIDTWYSKGFESSTLTLEDKECKFITLEEYSSNDIHEPDYFLQIAPGKGYTGDNLEVKEKFIFAGEVAGVKPSFNYKGSSNIVDKFFQQGKLVCIPSEIMSGMRLNEELLNKFQGAYLENIVFTAFKLAFGRMHPKHPVAPRFAEGLVNPEKGRGVNYKSVMIMAEKLGISTTHGNSTPYSPESIKYFTDIFGEEWDGFNKDDNGLPSQWGPGSSIDLLTKMNDVLNWININATGNDTNIFEQNGGEVFYSDFNIDTIPELLIPCWEYFKANASKLIDCYNPVYDLFAGYCLVGFIKNNNESRLYSSPEDFLEIVVNEF